MNEYPYSGANETWEQFADAQLDHTGTAVQHIVRDKRRAEECLAALRLMVRGY